MNCQPGDLAIITESVMGISIGKIVQCQFIDGPPHSLYGDVWKVTSNDELTTEYGVKGHSFHVPDKWLRPLRPGELSKKTDKTLELTE